MTPAFFFYLFGAIAVLGALGMVASVRNVVAGALSLVCCLVALGGVYVLLEAYLVGVLQILVYAGAIVVLFLFVVMLLNLRGGELGPARQPVVRVAAVAVAAALLWRFLALLPGLLGSPKPLPEGFGGYREIGRVLFTDYVLAFEVSSLLLLAAMVGAVVLVKRRID